MYVVVVAGVGGLGCALLKLLAEYLPTTTTSEIVIVDPDVIEISNLNRQDLFDLSDIGKPKVSVAHRRLTHNYPNLVVHPYQQTIQTYLKTTTLQTHNIVFSCLDNIEGRRAINDALTQSVEWTCVRDKTLKRSSIFPILIDGGCEGLMGQARIIIPFLTACYECTLPSLTHKRHHPPICTIRGSPSNWVDCLQYARWIAWPSLYNRDPDLFDPHDIRWLSDTAKARATKFKLVFEAENCDVRRFFQEGEEAILPSIAASNAVIASLMFTKFLQITDLKNLSDFDHKCAYHAFNGEAIGGGYIFDLNFERVENCLVCGDDARVVFLPSEMHPSNTSINDMLELTKRWSYKERDKALSQPHRSSYTNTEELSIMKVIVMFDESIVRISDKSIINLPVEKIAKEKDWRKCVIHITIQTPLEDLLRRNFRFHVCA